MLHGFMEPTMPTTTEAKSDSPQNCEESPAGNPNADERRCHQLNSAAYTLYMHLLIFPDRTPKLLSSQCNCTSS